MQKFMIIVAAFLAVCALTGCSRSYTMTTSTGSVIQTQGKPEAEPSTGMTAYADTWGYHREIKTSDIVKTTEGNYVWTW